MGDGRRNHWALWLLATGHGRLVIQQLLGLFALLLRDALLALALGFADVVQASSGGVALDAIFIDEGFGSLDAESLDLAIRALLDLQATGRMIGIISHVAELKEQMPLRLDVIADRGGSRVRLVKP